MGLMAISTNPLDYLLAFIFFCTPVTSMVFPSRFTPLNRNESLRDIFFGTTLLIIGVVIATLVFSRPVAPVVPLRLVLDSFVISATKAVCVCIVVLGGVLTDKIMEGGDIRTSLGFTLSLVAAGVMMLLNFLPPT
jgi:hypothetical protein